MPTIHITTMGIPIKTEKRQLHRQNAGLYCRGCSEFIAVAVAPDERQVDISFSADAPIDVLCPFCNRLDQRAVSDIQILVLRENNKRVRPRDAH